MRAIVILSVILVGAFAATTLEKQLIRDVFNQWKVANGKSYQAGHEEEHRFNVFLKNYVTIQTHNQKKTGVTLALNQFADLTSEEFAATHTGLIHHTKKTHATHHVHHAHHKTAKKVGDLAASVDWRTKGAVTPVKNQLACGSCWAFSAVGALEGLYFIEKGTLESFSEQQLVDCDPKSHGCNGGWMDYAFEYVAGHGIERGSDYPYTAKTGKCAAEDSKAIKFTTGFVDVPAKNADALKAAIAHQPVSVAIQANQSVFQFYRSGVITSGCGASLNHGVLAVGYNTFDGKEAYIVKNSWGTVWGDKGYVLIGTDPSQNGGAGVCGILSVSSYPK